MQTDLRIDYEIFPEEYNKLTILQVGRDKTLFSPISFRNPQLEKYLDHKILRKETERWRLFSVKNVINLEVRENEELTLFFFPFEYQEELTPNDQQDLLNLLQEDRIHCFFCYHKKTSSLTWGKSFWSRINIFWRLEDKNLTLFTDERIDPSLLSKKALANFQENGFLHPDIPLYESHGCAQPLNIYHYSLAKNEIKNIEKLNYSFPEHFRAVSTEELYETLQSVVKDFQRSKYFCLTGGADTRLLLSALKNPEEYIFWVDSYEENLYQKIKEDNLIFNRIVNALSLDWIKFTNFKNDYCLTWKNNPRTVLNPQLMLTQLNSMTGVFGGEFLGGAIYDLLTPTFIRRPEDQANFFREVSQSQLSTLYFPDQHWINPSRMAFCYSYAPFLHPRVLNLIVQIHPDKLKNYQYYREVFLNHASQWLKFPFASPIVDHQSFKGLDLPAQKPLTHYDQSQLRQGLSPTEQILKLLASGTIPSRRHDFDFNLDFDPSSSF